MPTTNKIVGSKVDITSSDFPVICIIPRTPIIAIKTVTNGIIIPLIDLKLINKKIMISSNDMDRKRMSSNLIFVRYVFCPLIFPA